MQSERLESEAVQSDAIRVTPPASEPTSPALSSPQYCTVDLAAAATEPSSVSTTAMDTLCEDFCIPLLITSLRTRDPGLTRLKHATANFTTSA